MDRRKEGTPWPKGDTGGYSDQNMTLPTKKRLILKGKGHTGSEGFSGGGGAAPTKGERAGSSTGEEVV